MPYEYLASVQSAVRRVNDRISTLADKFGSNSAIVNNYTSMIDVLLGDNTRYKDGVIQISKPSDIFDDSEKMQALSELEDSVKTWGSYREQYEREYIDYADEQGASDKLSMPDFIQTMQNLSGALRDVPSDAMPSEALKIMQIKGRKKTYAELIEVANILKKKGLI